ncbi:MAG TPA: chemotaxis protein CheC [Methanospirillum sp.]|nr:chemotaxis protein CheC [Methanospirillum sp.]
MTRFEESVLDGLKEIVNIGVGRAAGSLNDLTSAHVTLQVPMVLQTCSEDIFSSILPAEQSFIAINLDYTGAFSGTTALIFPRESADKLVFLLTGESTRTDDNDELWRMALIEVGNIVVNAVMGSITNILGGKLEFLLPGYLEESMEKILHSPMFIKGEDLVVAHAVFHVEKKGIEGKIMIILGGQSIRILGEKIQKKMDTLRK